MNESKDEMPRPKRRPRYRGRNPQHFHEKYKELNPQLYPETVGKVLASGKTPAGAHRAVLVDEVLAALRPKQGNVLVDATLGYGGHAVELLRRIAPGGRLIGVDTDSIELPKTEERLRRMGFGPDVLTVVHSNFGGLPKILAVNELAGADGILADLGCSSMQLDDPSRGFSYKREAPLDLRMNPEKGRPASALLASLELNAIADLLRDNADEPSAIEIAQAIVTARARRPLVTARALAEAVTLAAGLGKGRRPDETLARVFQALRIAVNEEYTALEMFLRHLPGCLRPGGRAAILSFHSGEDRRVKKAFAEGLRRGIYRAISPEIIRPTPEEVRANPRAASAKLRWAEAADGAGDVDRDLQS